MSTGYHAAILTRLAAVLACCFVSGQTSTVLAQASSRVETGSLTRDDPQLSKGEYFDRYTITGTRGQLLTIDLRSEEFDTFVQMHPLDEQGEIVESQSWFNDDFEDSRSHSRLEVELPADGTYVIFATSYEGKETGRYELTITSFSGRVESGKLADGDSQLNTGEFVDVYEFTANAGQQIVVDLHSDDFDTYLFIRHADDKEFQVDNDDYEADQHRSQIVLDAPRSGTYLAFVTSYGAGETGAYRLSISNPLPSSSLRQETGQLASGDAKLDSGEYFDLYQIEAAEGDEFVIDLYSDDFDTYLFVRSEAAPDLELDNDDFDSDSKHSQITLAAPKQGVYRVYVTSYKAGESGAYRLTIDGGGAAAGAPAASPASRRESGELAAGDETLESGEFFDVYEFEGRPGQQARIRLNSSEFDPYLILINPLGEAEENDDFEGQTTVSQIDAELSELGTYRVAVTSYKKGETGRYELLIEFSEASRDVEQRRDLVQLESSGERSGRLEAGDLSNEGRLFDQYAFSGTAGQRVVIGMSSTDFDPVLVLTLPDGTTLEFDDTQNSRDALLELELLEAGRYRLAATSYGANAGGDYKLNVNLSGAGASAPGTQPAVPVANVRRVLGVFVGISDYPGDENDLLFCDDDARVLHDIMRSQFNMTAEDSALLLNDQATVANISDALQRVGERARPADLLLFFYSGHGSYIDGAPDSLDPDGRHETIAVYDGAIVDDDFAGLVNNSAAGNCVVVLDSCLSGGFQKNFVTAPGRFGLFSSEEVVLSAVAAKFRAGGYLSRFFVEAVGDNRDDADRDGNRELTAAELSQYIDLRYEDEVRTTKGGAGEDYIDLGSRSEDLSRQNLVTGWGGMAPNQVLFRWE